MGQDGSESGTDSSPARRSGRYRLDAIVEEYDDGPDECTIFPPDVSDVERMSTWITAREPHFVRLEDVR